MNKNIFVTFIVFFHCLFGSLALWSLVYTTVFSGIAISLTQKVMLLASVLGATIASLVAHYKLKKIENH